MQSGVYMTRIRKPFEINRKLQWKFVRLQVFRSAQLIVSIRTEAVISCSKNAQSDKQIVQTCISFEDIGEKSSLYLNQTSEVVYNHL